MSSKKYATPLQLNVTSSPILLTFLVLLHLIGIVVVVTLPINLLLTFITNTTLIIAAAYLASLHALLTRNKSITKIIWDANDEWLLFTNDSKTEKAVLQDDSFIHPRLTVLRFKEPGKFLARSVVLLKDNIDKNDFRRLRVRLKLSRNSDQEVKN